MSFYKANGILQIKNHTIFVSIKEQRRPENIKNIGIDNIQGYYVGNVVKVDNDFSIKIFPSDIEITDKGVLNVDNDSIIGEFVITGFIRTRFKSVENVIGQPFQGYLFNQKPYSVNDWV